MAVSAKDQLAQMVRYHASAPVVSGLRMGSRGPSLQRSDPAFRPSSSLPCPTLLHPTIRVPRTSQVQPRAHTKDRPFLEGVRLPSPAQPSRPPDLTCRAPPSVAPQFARALCLHRASHPSDSARTRSHHEAAPTIGCRPHRVPCVAVVSPGLQRGLSSQFLGCSFALYVKNTNEGLECGA
jgi:hypothetical protein